MSDFNHAHESPPPYYETRDSRQAKGANSYWFDNPWLDRTVHNVRVRDSHGREHLITEQPSPEFRAALASSIHTLRSFFDLPTAWLAQMLRVQRQTIYAWMKEAALCSTAPRAGNAQRISDLKRIGEQWRTETGSRMLRKHALLHYENRSLLDWIAESELQDPEFVIALEEFAKMARPHELLKPLSQRLYRGEPHPGAHRERFLEPSSVFEPKE